MYGQEVYGLFLFATFGLIIWGIFVTTWIAQHLLAKRVAIVQKNIVLSCILLFLLATTLIILLFKQLMIGFLIPYFIYCAIATGAFGYLLIQKYIPNWWAKLNTRNLFIKIFVCLLTCIIIAGAFGLLIILTIRLLGG